MPGANQGQDPRNVIAPRSRWQMVDVLYEGEHWSMAIGRWKNEAWRPVLAQRWNGDPGSLGTPNGHGHPTWFIVPEDLYEMLLDSVFIPTVKKDFVRNFLELG